MPELPSSLDVLTAISNGHTLVQRAEHDGDRLVMIGIRDLEILVSISALWHAGNK